jgi:hypothetical protein
MKRAFLAALLCLTVLMFPAVVSAATPVASITGPSTVRAGKALIVTFYMNGTGLGAVQGEFHYDASQLTYTGFSGMLAHWAGEPDGTTPGKVTFFSYDDTSVNYIDSKVQLFKLEFTVKGTVAAGSTIGITTAQLEAGGMDETVPLANASYSVVVAAAPTAGPTSAATPTPEPTAEPTATPKAEATPAPSDAPSPSPQATATTAPTTTPVPEPWSATSGVPVWATALVALVCGGGGFLLGKRAGRRVAD